MDAAQRLTCVSDSPASHSRPLSSHTFYGVRLSAMLETLAFLSLALTVDGLFGDGSRFLHAPLHPFWIIVLLVTVQYGPGEALMAALLSSLFLLAGNLPEQSMSETLYEYVLRVASLPFLWAVAALFLGSIRGRQLREKQRLVEQASQSEASAQAITKAYEAAKQSKEYLELRLAEERKSVLTVYKVARSLETTQSGDVQMAAAELVRTALGPIKFSLYRWEEGAFVLDAAHGWEKADEYRRHFDVTTPLASAMIEKRTLSVTQAKDEAILDSQGMLAGPIIDEKTGKVYGMLKIEDLGFMQLGLRAVEIFRIVCQWIGHAYGEVPQAEAAQMHFLTRFAQRQGFNLFRVVVRIGGREKLSVCDREHLLLTLRRMLRENLRGTDLAFFAPTEGDVAMLLSCDDESDVQLVITRLQIAVIRSSDAVFGKVTLSYDVKALHLAEPFRHAPLHAPTIGHFRAA